MSYVTDYLSQIQPEQRAALTRVCEIVREIIPEAEETKSYSMPTFKYQGKPILAFLAYEHHLSIYPFGGAAIDKFRDELDSYELSKGTIRFSIDHPLPDELLRKIVVFRKELIEA